MTLTENEIFTRQEELASIGVLNARDVYWNLSSPRLYEEAIRRHEGQLAHLGPLVVNTLPHTGRSPLDRFVVEEPGSRDHIWWGPVNRPFEPVAYEALKQRMLAYLQGRDIFVQDCFVGADERYRLPVRVITERAWHSLFAHDMFLQPHTDADLREKTQFTIIHAPGFNAIPGVDKTRSGVFIILNFAEQTVLIGGTEYAGEIKKSMFTVMNYLLPQKQVLSMHCSANMGQRGDVAIFFGLSGTGKTTLSADPNRTLIGDDEHGWSNHGIFNFEGGCYAKVIRLNKESEPEIYETTRRFGTILENVVIDTDTGRLDLDDDSITENTRAAYPLTHIDNASRTGIGGHPGTVIMLTADAFGVLPPLAKLSSEQAMYQFLSGYTAKVAGTESGVTEPSATFSTCFGAPFLALSPTVYANLLGERIRRHGSNVWLVNTGWTGGAVGSGQRMPIEFTRAMISAILEGDLDDVPLSVDPVFGLRVPAHVPEVPDSLLEPRKTWSDQAAYDHQALKLAAMFKENFRQYEQIAPVGVAEAGPNVR